MAVIFERAGLTDSLITDEDEPNEATTSLLGAEPLSADEIEDVEAHARDFAELDEPMEGALAVLRKSTEATLTIDPDAADVLDDAADEHLSIRDHKERRH